MRYRCRSIVLFAAFSLTLPAAFAAPVADFVSAPATASTSAIAQPAEPVQCDDTYYHYLPGMVDYCLGLRAWQRGRHEAGLKLLTLAAGWGSKGAQYALGLIHYNGHHVPVDRAPAGC